MRLIDPIALKKSIAFSAIMSDGKSLETIIDEQLTIQPEPHWIPCIDRLPEEEGEYLITDDAGGVKHVEVDTLLHYEDGRPFWLYSQNAVAWCELPEPYKGVTECD